MEQQTEKEILEIVRLESMELGIYLWRNNVGAMKTQSGFIRFGLANDSEKLNSILKSSDLIGIKPVHVTQDMVGKIIGQFMCREIKRVNWKYKNTPREKAQLNWITLINDLGGDADFTTGKGSFKNEKKN